MNDQLQEFARANIKDGLSQLTELQQMVFKWMYSPDNHDLPIDEVVDKMDADKLDWAMRQVENTRKLIKGSVV